MICHKCISHNPEQAEACHWCGAVLRQEQEVSSAETVVACVSCGGQINPTANFCNQCGVARIPLNEPVETEPQLACAHCGGSLNLGDNYCKWCGLPMPNSTGSTSTPAAPTRPIWRKVAAPWGQGAQRKLENEQRRIAESQQKEAARVAFRESIEESFALKEAKRVAFRESIEESFALKEEQRAQKELEQEAARRAAREAAKIADAEKKERRAQKEAEQEAARKEEARRERERAPVKSGDSDMEGLMTLVEIFLPAIIIVVKTYIETRQPGDKLDIKQLAAKWGIPSAAVPYLTNKLTEYFKKNGMKLPW